MGYAVFQRKSNAQLARHIRSVAADSLRVVFTKHARQQMARRKISIAEALMCLRNGSISRTPEPNLGKDTLECQVERYVAGCECKVIVALDDADPDMVVVTVMNF